jgi:hypothetical protein
MPLPIATTMSTSNPHSQIIQPSGNKQVKGISLDPSNLAYDQHVTNLCSGFIKSITTNLVDAFPRVVDTTRPEKTLAELEAPAW